ncbi:cellulose biosynthesis cyclic di-GMP-binding regulatory protein BcsB [Caballeronia sp. LZ065]|uniref:cellulose biosynthesis cyclic di-GMP-binding regulatory protein BcsB n=1 Tax=Caballeronia sp. LZ065 TaxID=3038571 RepID=UPI00285BA430|nr:cellulose biosynthesis cyclic di-GMP-binding regulatory protein BcsB [Caballeronia sp. LZ065]MDR5784815.1 cellulose biosynthesis cyclic di-GMP-binding regulatory protein BcsB [Caballeronia sp. LZ065]
MKPVVSFCMSLALAASALYAAVLPAAQLAPPAAAALNPAASANASTIHVPFAALGAYQAMHLRGLEDARSIALGVRLDRVVTGARLRLRYTYSPSLVFPLSHVKVSLNNEVIATVPFDKDHAGSMVTQDIVLDPKLLTDYNQFGLRFIGHYTLDHCEDPANTALWADVSPTSEFILDTAPIKLPDDLALLPAPFFDARDVSRLTLPFVLPASPDNATLRSASVLASWFGALADYRQARFPALNTLPTDQHAVVIGTRAQLPANLTLPAIDGPTILVTDNPASTDRKLLIVTGNDAAQVDDATAALVLGRTAMSGASVKVAHVDIGKPREPYDAPRWMPTDRPVSFKELVDDPSQLQVTGGAPDAIRLNLRVPADLFSWNSAGVPLNLRYRYTAPTVQNNSALAVDINEQLVKSFRLPAAKSDDSQGRFSLPILASANNGANNALDIPAFRVGSSNQLQLRFTLESQKQGLCAGVASNPARAAVDPDSTIDFSGFVHYAQLPNLAFFANSGFPFTRYADLAQTAVVIPDRPAANELEALLTMMGHMGQWTGFPALRVSIARPGDVPGLAQKDLLVIGGAPSSPVFARWRDALPLSIASTAATPDQAAQGGMTRASFSIGERWRDGKLVTHGGASLDQSGPIAALMGFESPGTKGRSVVALAATGAGRLTDLLDVLERPDRVAQVQGDVSLVRRGGVDSMRVGDTYLVGYVPWYAKLWSRLMLHPVLLGLLGALAGLLIAVGAFAALQELAARRRGI